MKSLLVAIVAVRNGELFVRKVGLLLEDQSRHKDPALT
jgi:hypothetical protein